MKFEARCQFMIVLLQEMSMFFIKILLYNDYGQKIYSLEERTNE